ncbi:hypothetical protein FV222_00175 [Methylobacterium sp. WL103]|uniref:hypothetical protein n=1 Tax=Methylobacterium sp. WL103 TaxID=2603891 RepID=UPI0011C9E0D9|nr:hypothetical protein [Methylobacterium sp. WL103]TXN08922.1 hypothetical protein FV222_00175 [Methylobacterium sp. WL103]
MSEPANDAYPSNVAREILAKLTPAELADAEEEARAKGVTVELLILRAIADLIEKSDRDHDTFLRGDLPKGSG